MRRGVRLALLTLASIAVAPLAHAADDEGAERDAQARFEEGLARAKSGDFDAARISFTQAYAVLHRPRILWNLALSEEKTGHVLEALAHFKSVAHDPSADDSDRAGAQGHVASLYGQTGHIEVRAPAGAPITIDSGPVIGTAPLADVLDVAPGRHVIEARLAQGPSAVVVQPAAGEVVPASFLTPVETPGASPPSAAPLPKAPGPTAAASQAPPAPAEPHESTDTARIVVVAAAGGLAVAAVVLGVSFGVTSHNDANKASDLRGQIGGTSGCVAPTGSLVSTCSQLADAVSAENRNAGLSTGMYIAAGAIAVAGAITWFAWPKSGSAHATTARVSPILAPGLAGLSMGMTF